MEAIIEFKVKVRVSDDDASEQSVQLFEVGEALKDYLYDANSTRPFDTDPKIVDVTYQMYKGNFIKADAAEDEYFRSGTRYPGQ